MLRSGKVDDILAANPATMRKPSGKERFQRSAKTVIRTSVSQRRKNSTTHWSVAVQAALERKEEEAKRQEIVPVEPTQPKGKSLFRSKVRKFITGKASISVMTRSRTRTSGRPTSELMQQWTHQANQIPHREVIEVNKRTRQSSLGSAENTTATTTAGRLHALECSCRRAFARDPSDRSHTDLQALKSWFQRTKLKSSTDFESLETYEVCYDDCARTIEFYDPPSARFALSSDGVVVLSSRRSGVQTRR